MFFYLVIIIVDSVLLIILIYVWIIFNKWLMLIIKVRFCVVMFIEVNVVNKIIIDMFGILVIFFEVIISVVINISCLVNDKCILYIWVINKVVIDWYKVELFKLNE